MNVAHAAAPKMNITRDRCGINAIITDCVSPKLSHGIRAGPTPKLSIPR